MLTTSVPETICWHCGIALDAVTPQNSDDIEPHSGAVSLCMYCGAIAIFGDDLRLEPPTTQMLDNLKNNREFIADYMRFMWARQKVMLTVSLMQGG
jgi:hypothetical protein